MRTIHRKETILRQLGGEEYVLAWEHGAAGRLSKGKIHCSCWMCRRKSYDDPRIRDKRAAMDAALNDPTQSEQFVVIVWIR